MRFKEFLKKQTKELKELPQITKKFLKKNNLKADQVRFEGMVDNKDRGKFYAFRIIDKKHKRHDKVLTYIEK